MKNELKTRNMYNNDNTNCRKFKVLCLNTLVFVPPKGLFMLLPGTPQHDVSIFCGEGDLNHQWYRVTRMEQVTKFICV